MFDFLNVLWYLAIAYGIYVTIVFALALFIICLVLRMHLRAARAVRVHHNTLRHRR